MGKSCPNNTAQERLWRKRRSPCACAWGCREMRPKKELIRIVRSPEGEVHADPTGRRWPGGILVQGPGLLSKGPEDPGAGTGAGAQGGAGGI